MKVFAFPARRPGPQSRPPAPRRRAGQLFPFPGRRCLSLAAAAHPLPSRGPSPMPAWAGAGRRCRSARWGSPGAGPDQVGSPVSSGSRVCLPRRRRLLLLWLASRSGSRLLSNRGSAPSVLGFTRALWPLCTPRPRYS